MACGGVEMTEQARRRKAIQISPDLLHGFLTIGPARYIQCVEGLPENARFIFESDDWEPVPFGQILPTLRIQHRSFHVLPLLERAEMLLAGMYGG